MFPILITGKYYRQPVAKKTCVGQCTSHAASNSSWSLTPSHLHRYILNLTGSHVVSPSSVPNEKIMIKHLQCEAHRMALPLDHPLRFSMALPLRPYRPQRFIHQKLHPNPTKIFRHLQCEAHWTRSAVEVQHGSSSQAISMRSPPDQISR